MLGTSSTRQQTSPPASADALADIVLPDHEGNDVRLGDLWSDGPPCSCGCATTAESIAKRTRCSCIAPEETF